MKKWVRSVLSRIDSVKMFGATFNLRREKEQKAAEQKDIARMIRDLQQCLAGWHKFPKTLDDAARAKVLVEKLTQCGLYPVGGEYKVQIDDNGKRVESFTPEKWRTYLVFILPYVEEYGVDRALEETQRMNKEVLG